MAKNPKSVAAGKKAWEHPEDWKVSQVVADLPQGIEIGHRDSRKGLKVMVWSGEDHVGTLRIGHLCCECTPIDLPVSFVPVAPLNAALES